MISVCISKGKDTVSAMWLVPVVAIALHKLVIRAEITGVFNLGRVSFRIDCIAFNESLSHGIWKMQLQHVSFTLTNSAKGMVSVVVLAVCKNHRESIE